MPPYPTFDNNSTSSGVTSYVASKPLEYRVTTYENESGEIEHKVERNR